MPVLFFHAGVPGLDGGFIGVDVFFVISGYLISRLIYSELREGRFSIIAFYERRARRIAPAFFAVSLLTFVAAALFLFPTRLVEFCKSLLWSSLAGGNIYFWQESGYFGPEAGTQPLLHYWSLGVEEQFYFLFPALAALIWKWGEARLIWALVALFVLSLVGSELMLRHSPEGAFYLLPFRAWELLLGSLLALRSLPSPPTGAIAGAAVTAGAAIIVAAVVFLSQDMAFPGLAALLPVSGAALAIWGGERRSPAAQALGVSPLVYVGRISYSLYLVHWPILFFANLLLPDVDPAIRTAIVIAVSFLLADLSYRFVEAPTRKRDGFWKPVRIFALTAVGVFAGVGLSLATIVAGGFPGRLPADAQELLAYRYDRVEPYREGTCFLRSEQDQAALTPACLPTEGPLALIWGDSHAAHFVPGLKPALEHRGYSVAQITASGCPPVVGRDAPRRPNCAAINDFALGWIRQAKPVLVVLSAIWTLDSHLQSFQQQIAELEKLGAHTMILGPSPVFPDTVPVLLAERRAKGDVSTIWAGLPAGAFVYDNQLRRQFGGWPADYISILDIACPGQVCPLMVSDEPYYWDGEHLTTAGAQALVRGFASRIPAPR
jgi:peptidoglycan/LPS O-acetylase OafA/YrhL